MLNQFRSRYPQGSLVTELLCVDHGLYIVRCWIQAEGKTLATGLAAAQTVELAEDRARSRALALLDLDLTTATNLGEAVSHPGKTSTPLAELASSAPVLRPEGSKQIQNTQLSDISRANVAQNLSAVELTAFDTSQDAEQTSLVAEPTTFTTDEIPEPEVDSNQQPQPSISTSQQFSESLPPEKLVYPESNRDLSQDIIEKPSQNTPIDLSDIIAKSSVELRRLGWTNQQGRDYLLQTYGKRSRQLLTDQELLDFLRNLEAMPTPE